jgi:hypothetical protein
MLNMTPDTLQSASSIAPPALSLSLPTSRPAPLLLSSVPHLLPSLYAAALQPDSNSAELAPDWQHIA